MKLHQICNYCVANLSKHPEYECYPHWTFLIQKNQIVSIGVNRRFEPARKYGYHNHIDTSFIPKYHAELDAVRRCRVKLRNFYAVNVRMNKSGYFRIARPCGTCKNVLSVLGCSKVIYSTQNGWETLTW